MLRHSYLRKFSIRQGQLYMQKIFKNTQSTCITPSNNISAYLNISPTEAQYLCLKHPVLKKIGKSRMEHLIQILQEIGFREEVLLDEPILFGLLPVTLRYRYHVLKECGFINVSPKHLVSYLPIVKNKTIKELRNLGLIPTSINIENQLAGHMTQWPTSITTLILGDTETQTLFELRLKIIQRYLELVLELSENQFLRGVETYNTIKHRPLTMIAETVSFLQSHINIPNSKIKANLYLIHVDPKNLKQLVFKFRSIGGVDIKEIIRSKPKIAMKNYDIMLEIRQVLQDFGITDEAQSKCFEIYTLGPQTVKERLEKAKELPEFQALIKHPRFLKLIYHNSTALKRLCSLNNNNKRCLSINILSGCSSRYKMFEKAPGDQFGKSKDLLFCLSQLFGKEFNKGVVRNELKKHPFWLNVPVVQVQFVYKKLSEIFSNKDIYDNCQILLYPWNKIRDTLNELNKKPNETLPSMEHVDTAKLSKAQKLALALYFIEKKHYFTGNGVWTDEQIKNVVELTAIT